MDEKIGTMLKHFCGAKFSLRLFVPGSHEFDMADGTSMKSGKAMLKDPLEGLVKCNGRLYHTDVKQPTVFMNWKRSVFKSCSD